MLPDPLHPAVVHFPVVLAVLLPLFAIGALIAIRRGARPLVAWGTTVVVAAMLVASAWVSMETGEDQEEKVEDIVGERTLAGHEEAARLFTISSAVVLVVAGAGLARGSAGKAARVVATVGTIGILGAGYNVGRLGGELVYRHGAASAYTQPGAAVSGGEVEQAGEH